MRAFCMQYRLIRSSMKVRQTPEQIADRDCTQTIDRTSNGALLTARPESVPMTRARLMGGGKTVSPCRHQAHLKNERATPIIQKTLSARFASLHFQTLAGQNGIGLERPNDAPDGRAQIARLTIVLPDLVQQVDHFL